MPLRLDIFYPSAHGDLSKARASPRTQKRLRREMPVPPSFCEAKSANPARREPPDASSAFLFKSPLGLGQAGLGQQKTGGELPPRRLFRFCSSEELGF
jgi:hypothetical protein